MRTTLVALIALLAVCLSAAPARFSGAWGWAQGGADFHITIHEAGTKVSGDLIGTGLNGNRVSMGTFSGTKRNADAASVEWQFKDGDQIGPVAGTADLKLVNGKLRWSMHYEGAEEAWFPREAVLSRQAK